MCFGQAKRSTTTRTVALPHALRLGGSILPGFSFPDNKLFFSCLLSGLYCLSRAFVFFVVF